MKNIHVFPSRTPGKLGYIGESNQYHLFSNGENLHDLFDNLATYKDMYITSENPIEVDDWCLSLSKDAAYGEVYRCWDVALINEEDRKIALTTNKNLIQEGVQEMTWTEHLFKDRELVGINEDLTKQWVLFNAKDVAKTVGIDKTENMYKFPVKNPIPHLEDWFNMNAQQAAPQEQDVAAYKLNIVKRADENMEFSF
jgi:hypothetical protein